MPDLVSKSCRRIQKSIRGICGGKVVKRAAGGQNGTQKRSFVLLQTNGQDMRLGDSRKAAYERIQAAIDNKK